VSSVADLIRSLREHNARALDRLLLERFGGKVGRGLALVSSRRRERPDRAESLFKPSLTRCSQDTKDSENPSEMGDNAGMEREEHRAWT